MANHDTEKMEIEVDEVYAHQFDMIAEIFRIWRKFPEKQLARLFAEVCNQESPVNFSFSPFMMTDDELLYAFKRYESGEAL